MCNISLIWVNPLSANPTKWKMVKHTQINSLFYFSVCDHFVGLALKGLKLTIKALNKVHGCSYSLFIVQAEQIFAK